MSLVRHARVALAAAFLVASAAQAGTPVLPREQAQWLSTISANTLRGVQAKRPTVYQLKRGLSQLRVPLHVMSGDEDNNCLEPGIFMKRVCPSAWLTVVPNAGHAVNVEEPDLFNRLTAEFLAQVDSGRWRARDPRSLTKSTMQGK